MRVVARFALARVESRLANAQRHGAGVATPVGSGPWAEVGDAISIPGFPPTFLPSAAGWVRPLVAKPCRTAARSLSAH